MTTVFVYFCPVLISINHLLLFFLFILHSFQSIASKKDIILYSYCIRLITFVSNRYLNLLDLYTKYVHVLITRWIYINLQNCFHAALQSYFLIKVFWHIINNHCMENKRNIILLNWYSEEEAGTSFRRNFIHLVHIIGFQLIYIISQITTHVLS